MWAYVRENIGHWLPFTYTLVVLFMIDSFLYLIQYG
jgi:hypothetical protein